jgi:ribosome-interacting GTPase 1
VSTRIHNADVHLGDDYDIDDLVDVIEGSRVYIPAIYVVNKIDQITLEELEVMDRLPHYCPVSSLHLLGYRVQCQHPTTQVVDGLRGLGVLAYAYS